jgi:tetratricopeptide (TPR) repeat protein
MRLDWLHRAAAADPLAPQPHAELAALYLQLWLESPSAEIRDRFQRSLDAAIRLQPRSHLRWMQAGKNQLAIFDKSRRTEDAAKAEHAMKQAVELYPTNATLWAELALLRDKVGDASAAREAADQAILLDQTTPHADKKLPPSLRDQLISRGLMHQVP